MKYFLSIFSFLFVVALVTTGATYSVKLSMSENSNYKMLSQAQKDRERRELRLAENNTKQNESEVLGESTDTEMDCLKKDPKYNVDTYSVVNYLHMFGKKSSFEARLELANYYKIDNYLGRTSQNKELLENIKQDYICK